MTPQDRMRSLNAYKAALRGYSKLELIQEVAKLQEQRALYQGAIISLKAALDGTTPFEELGVGKQADLGSLTTEEFHNRLIPEVPPLELPKAPESED